MTPDHSDRAVALFFEAAVLPQADREAWLAARCDGDERLRAEVERLLAGAAALPDEFLEPASLHPQVATGDALLPAGTRLGEFVVRRLLGSGATGIVYLAEQRYPLRAVALKVLRHGLARTTARRRFELEADLLGRLQHPGIAQIHAAHPGDAATPPFIAMELVDGQPITDHADAGALATRARVELIAQVCDAVQHAHQRGIIHRDLKPTNILVDTQGQPKVLDFGVARAMDASAPLLTIETTQGQLVGTVPYMSPEQLRGGDAQVDTRSDIYALGVLTFRLLTGRLPFADGDPSLPELARRIAERDAPRLGQIVDACGGDLETIVACALAKDREQRYASAADLGADLRRWLRGEPIAVSAASRWSIVARRAARYRRALAASAVVVTLLSALTMYAVVQRGRANQASDRLARELSASNIERARMLAASGSFLTGEALAWRELLNRPESTHALWTLSEIYARHPAVWTWRGEPAGATCVRFSPDGARLVAAGQDERIRILDRQTGQVVRELRGHAGKVLQAAFSADGRRIISVGRDKTIRFWDASSGVAFAPAAPLRAEPSGLAVPVRGNLVATAGLDGRIELWTDAGEHRRVLRQSAPPARAIAIDPDGALVAAAFDGGEVRVWDAGSGRESWRAASPGADITALAFQPRSHRLFVGRLDQRIHIHDLRTGRLERALQPANGSVRRLHFDPTGRLLAVAGWWRTILWRVDAGAPNGFVERTLSNGSYDVHMPAVADALVTAEEGAVRLWAIDATAVRADWRAHTGRVAALSAGADPTRLVTAGQDGTVRWWKIRDGHLVEPDARRAVMPGDAIHSMVAAPDLRWAAMASARMAAVIARDDVSSTALPGLSRATIVARDESGRTLMVGTAEGEVSCWTMDNGHPTRRWVAASGDGEVLSLAIAEDVAVIGHRLKGIVMRALADGTVIRRTELSGSAFAVALSADRRLIAVSTWMGPIHLVEAATGRIARTLNGHARVVRGLSFSADARLLASAGRDGSTRLWDVESGAALATIAQREAGAERVAFLSHTLAIGYDDGIVQIVEPAWFMRFVAGNAAFQVRALGGDGTPNGDRVLAWARQILTR